MGKNDTMNIAIIGAGNEGFYLVSALNECQSANIVGFCGRGGDRLNAALVSELNIPVFERLEELPSIGDVDIIIDVGPSDEGLSDSLETLGDVEVVRGRGADIMRVLAEKSRGHHESVESIFASAVELAAKKESKSIYRAIVEGAIELTGCATGSLLIFDERREICRLADAVGYAKDLEDYTSWEIEPGGITELLLDKENPLYIADAAQEPRFDNPVMNEGTMSVIATALREGETVIGLLFVGDFVNRAFSDNQFRVFYAYAAQAAMALQKALLLEKNEKLTTTDALTGLNNSRHFFELLDSEIRRAKRYGGYFSVLMMDIDNLALINDAMGHAKGDWAIKRVAEIINSCSRLTDYKARYGGDEFALVLPSTSCPQASVLANRIRRQVNDVFISGNQDEMRLSISVGIAEFPCLGTDADSLVAAVNTALTVCKRRGRNLVCCYEDSGEPASMS
ncbi:MAG: diguanylate cyclase [Actinobacteria bacterium]|nr:diguanylate cyclase [Actinomycetota bacterium]